jgi:hypothetical protein
MILWPPTNLTCWKEKLKFHEEKRNQYFIENSKITRKKHICIDGTDKLREKIFSIIFH